MQHIELIKLTHLQVLDALIGHNDALFRRAQLKALVSIHGQEVNLHLLHKAKHWHMHYTAKRYEYDCKS